MSLMEVLGLHLPGTAPPSASAGGSPGKKVTFDPVVTQIPDSGSAVRIGTIATLFTNVRRYASCGIRSSA